MADSRASRAAVLEQNSTFTHLTEEQSNLLCDAMVFRAVAAGDDVYRQGDPADDFYIIEEGQCAVYAKAGTDAERLLVILKNGESFGEHALVSGEARETTVRARTDVKLWCIGRASYEKCFLANRSSLVKETLGFIIEKGDDQSDEAHLFGSAAVVENAEFSTTWYSQLFAGNEHINYLGVAEEVDQFVLSVLKEEDLYRTMLWTKNGTERMCVPITEVSHLNPEQMVKYYFGLVTRGKLKKVTTSDIETELLKLEEMQTYGKYKFGIMHVKEGQTTEEEWFNNKDGSPEFDEFLGVLGEKVQLCGWEKFRAGLDVKDSRTTGDYSVYTQFQGYEIMFHVSTMLPYRPKDPQQIERKRHIGNDIAVIIFQDSNCTIPFAPEVVTSNFNHIWAVVRVDTDEHGEKRYRLSVVNKSNVAAYGPQLPRIPLFAMGADSDFRDFLLAKLVNGERSCYQAPAFKSKMRRTVEHLIKEIHDTFKNKASKASAMPKVTGTPHKPLSIATPGCPQSELFGEAGTQTASLFKSVPVLKKFPYEVTAFDAWGLYGRRFVLATDDGVFMYSPSQAESERIKKVLDVKRVVKLRVLPTLGLIFLNSAKDNNLYVYALSLLSTDPEPLTGMFEGQAKPPKAEFFHVDTVDDVVYLSTFYHRSCHLFVWNETKFVEKTNFTLPGHLSCVSVINGQYVLGIDSDFYMYNLTKPNAELVLLYRPKGRLVPLKAVHVKNNCLLLCYNTKAIPIDFEGKDTKEMKYEMRWNGLPIAIVHMFPYVLGITSAFAEIRTVINGKLVQTLPLKAKKLLSASSKGVYVSGEANSLTFVTFDSESLSAFPDAPEYVLEKGVLKDVSPAANAERVRGDAVWKISSIESALKPTQTATDNTSGTPDSSTPREAKTDDAVSTKRYATLAALISSELSDAHKRMVQHANRVHEELEAVKAALQHKNIQALANSSSNAAAYANDVTEAMSEANRPRIKRLEALKAEGRLEVPNELLVPVTQFNKEYLVQHTADLQETVATVRSMTLRMEIDLERNGDPMDAVLGTRGRHTRDDFVAAVEAVKFSLNTLEDSLKEEDVLSPQAVYYVIKDVISHLENMKTLAWACVDEMVCDIRETEHTFFDKINSSNQKLISSSYSVINAPSDKQAVRRLLHLCEAYDDMLEEIVFSALKRGKRMTSAVEEDVISPEANASPVVEADEHLELSVWEEPSAWDDPSKVKFESPDGTKATATSCTHKLLVRACTLNKVIEYMTVPLEHDPEFVPMCVLTLKTYTTPAKFLSKLLERFNPPPAVAADLPSETLLDTRCRVLMVIDFWLSNGFSDFSTQLLDQVNSFIDVVAEKRAETAVPAAWVQAVRDTLVKQTNLAAVAKQSIDKASEAPKTVLRLYTGRPRAAPAGPGAPANDMSALFKTFMVTPTTTVHELHISMLEKLDLPASDSSDTVVLGVKYGEVALSDVSSQQTAYRGSDVTVVALSPVDFPWDLVSVYDRFEFRYRSDVPSIVMKDAALEVNKSAKSFLAAETEALTHRRITGQSVDSLFYNTEDREVAASLTMADNSAFQDLVLPSDLVTATWKEDAPLPDVKRVSTMINSYRNVMIWTIEKILSAETAKDRAAVFSKFVRVELQLLDLRNFHSLLAILEGLTSPPVTRLKQTKKLVKSKLLAQLSEMELLLSQDSECARYRAVLANGMHPTIPSMTIVMKELETLAKDQAAPLIDISSRRLYFRKLSELKGYQKESFNIHTTLVRSQIMRLKIQPDVTRELAALMDLSMQREPEERKK